MANTSRNKKNQPPTGRGKDQPRLNDAPRTLNSSSVVLQAQRGHPELNLGDAAEEAATAERAQNAPARPKAGR
jgi:hypothetical protein